MRKDYSQEELRIIRQFKKNNPNICYYCGKHVEGKDKTVDHKMPIDRGGKTWYSNLCIACNDCNQEKGNMTDSEYIEYRYNKKPEYIKKIKKQIGKDKYKSRKLIDQEHEIMEARHDSTKRIYLKSYSYYAHMMQLFNSI